ncbi:nectin-1-like isoform X2 [Acipenser oxyrinchus oxyrinchus]|uniref:Nectin-1-like isoform X2 n=1 Tax=Acipenser oxyrinchus oxyrinchus TaxID=40147 RepID=A0AAD8FTK5_ACIOX|nr:nectin-1-like isoform X2 [Acipenser oxyrinchus oxyrinchus]
MGQSAFTGACIDLPSLLISSLAAAQPQVVQVDDSVSGFVGAEVVLSCTFSNTNPNVKITQVTWQKLLNGTKQNVAIANPTMGVSVLPPYKDRVTFRNPAVGYRTPSLEDATIRLSGLRLSDEAAYICEYATFPTGNRENQLNLTVLARPINRMTLTSPTITALAGQTSKKVVATCVSSNGKPPSVITWETKLKGSPPSRRRQNPNGTVTVHSNYLVVPSREIHRQQLTCIVNYQSVRTTDTLTLNVLYEPEVTIEGFDGNWYLNRQDVKLTCKSDANPPVTVYQWKLLNGTMPVNVEVLNSTLFFKGPVTSDLAGTYVCEAANVIGTRSGLVEVNVTEFPNIPGGPRIPPDEHSSGMAAVIGALWGVILLGLAACCSSCSCGRQRTFKGDYNTKKHVFGNGYSKAAGLPPHPPMPQSLHYPDDSDDEKKPAGSGLGGKQDFDPDSEDLKRPYFTVDEGESHEDFDGRTLSFQYDPEPEIADDMVSQNDGSVISKKEWYV